MRHLDLNPLYRTTVGFDRLFNLLDGLAGPDGNAPTYPPYNIERLSDNAYRITMAVAGFSPQDIDLEAKENTLTVKGDKSADNGADEDKVIYRGIASRAFERRFQLADYVKVKGATMENGLLHIELEREIPEEMKPRKIAIGSNSKKQKTIEQA